MATRDQSQNVGFVYTNIYALYQKAKTVAQNPTSKKDMVFQTEELGHKVITFNPSLASKLLKNSKNSSLQTAFGDLKSNVEKLQEQHSKLRFMLQELSDLLGKKKNS